MDEGIVGVIEISKSVEINFYIDEYKDKIFANIRKFSKSDRYTGPTKQGIKLSPEKLAKILEHKSVILALAEEPVKREICRIKKNYSTDIVVKMVLYEGKYGLDFREIFKTEDGSEGFGKGIRIRVEDVENAIEFMQIMLAKINSDGDIETTPSIPENKTEEADKPGDESPKNNNDIPKDYEEYF